MTAKNLATCRRKIEELNRRAKIAWSREKCNIEPYRQVLSGGAFSVRRERVDEVRRWLENYQRLKAGIEAICELNHELLRPTARASKREGA